MILNFGMTMTPRMPRMPNRRATARTMIQPMPEVVRYTMMMPPMARMGE